MGQVSAGVAEAPQAKLGQLCQLVLEVSHCLRSHRRQDKPGIFSGQCPPPELQEAPIKGLEFPFVRWFQGIAGRHLVAVHDDPPGARDRTGRVGRGPAEESLKLFRRLQCLPQASQWVQVTNLFLLAICCSQRPVPEQRSVRGLNRNRRLATSFHRTFGNSLG